MTAVVSKSPPPSRKRRKKRTEAVVAGAPPAVSPEDRLKAFGEDFLSRIDGRPAVPQRPEISAQTATTGATGSAVAPAAGDGCKATAMAGRTPRKGAGRRKRRRRREREEGDGSGSQEAESVFGRGVPVSVPAQPEAGVSPASATGGGAAGAVCRHSPNLAAMAERRRFMSGKVAKIHAHSLPSAQHGHGRRRHGGDDDMETEFRSTLRDVIDFVTPQLGKRERKQYEEAKIRALGGTVDPRPKTPYALLQKQLKGHQEKRRRLLEEEKVLGVSMSANQHRPGWAVDKLLKKKKEAIKDKRRRREDRFLDIGMGAREKRGMAVIPNGALRKYRGCK